MMCIDIVSNVLYVGKLICQHTYCKYNQRLKIPSFLVKEQPRSHSMHRPSFFGLLQAPSTQSMQTDHEPKASSVSH
jgi:hypothetical protein